MHGAQVNETREALEDHSALPKHGRIEASHAATAKENAMSQTETPPGTHDTEALVGRLFGAVIDTLEIASIHLGGRLGFYRALADHGDSTPAQLAVRTGTVDRYVREWLEQQAVAGFLSVDNSHAAPEERRYKLPAAYPVSYTHLTLPTNREV